MEIARARDPGAAAPAAPRALTVGYDPKAARIAGKRAAARFVVGRVDRVQTDDAPGLPRSRGFGVQKSDCAAAMAASVSPDGANTKTMMRAVATASTLRATTSGRSKGFAGSSKYMSLTMRR